MKFRKVAAVIASLAIAASLSVPALADEGISLQEADPSTQVTGTYVDGGQGAAVYRYGYQWGSMKLRYNAPGGGDKVWNPETHEYEAGSGGGSSDGGWVFTSGATDITVHNHSNRPVNVSLTFDSSYDGFNGGFTEPSFTLVSAEGTTVDNAPSKTVKFVPMEGTGGLKPGETDVVLGTITLHVEP